jgi:hypothetical protein
VEKCEETDKNKGIASSSNHNCKVYKMFNIIIVLRHEPKFSPGSAIKCHLCLTGDCTSNYGPEVDCPTGYCAKLDIDKGK